jgi:hypothetical protein
MICFKDQNTKASCRKVQLQMQCYKWDTINNFGINHLPPRLFNFISYFTILFKWEMHPSRKFILTTVQSAQTMSLKCFELVRLAHEQCSAGFFLPLPSHIILFILPAEHYSFYRPNTLFVCKMVLNHGSIVLSQKLVSKTLMDRWWYYIQTWNE